MKTGDSMWTTDPDNAFRITMRSINRDLDLGYLSKAEARHLANKAKGLRLKGQHRKATGK